MAGDNTYVGIVRETEKPWGKEFTLSLSEKDLKTCDELKFKGWVKIAIKMRREPEGDKVGYGSIYTPESAQRGSGGASEASGPLVEDDVDVPDVSDDSSDDLPL